MPPERAVFTLDELDRAIMKILQRDGRETYTAIAGMLGVAEGTIRKRVNRLIEEGIMKIVAVTDPSKLGMNFMAIVGVHVSSSDLGRIIETLSAMPEVREITVCTGTYDLIIEVVARTNDDLFGFLTEKLRKIPGIAGSETSLVLKVPKHSYSWDGWRASQAAGRGIGEAGEITGERVIENARAREQEGGRGSREPYQEES
ncbi:MAG TPA: Lrp/AsnC family transcriptional regulator [Firmicutes bacterium]|nr:Lrp/AsnC family transcriptional regulator [Bacillota bacterium]